jgi:hypothetical protein
MSTAALSDRPPLHAVRPPTTTDRFALLLRIRRAARQALDLAIALPRAAAGWVIRQARSLLAGGSANGLLTGAGSVLRSALGVVRAVGVLPVTAALVSSPPVWRATVRATGAVEMSGPTARPWGRPWWQGRGRPNAPAGLDQRMMGERKRWLEGLRWNCRRPGRCWPRNAIEYNGS